MANLQTVGQRISQLVSHLGISKNAFAASLDKTATVIQHLVDERNKPGFDLLCKIFEVYPNISKDWLLQGNGDMLTNAEPTAPKQIPVPAPAPEEKAVAPEPTKPVARAVAPEPVAAPVEDTTPPTSLAPVAEAPTASPVSAPFVASAGVAPMPAFTSAPPMQAPIPSAATAPPTVDPNASLQAALYAQQLSHQLALAEMRNQHLQEQQRMMQQMMEMMQRQLSR